MIENISKVIANMDRKKGRIFWRSFADRVHSPVLAHIKADLVDTYDRVGWYLTQFIGPVPEPYDPAMLECTGTDSRPVNSFLDDVAVMAAMAKQGLASKKDVRAFVTGQEVRRVPRASARPRSAHAARGAVGQDAEDVDLGRVRTRGTSSSSRVTSRLRV